MIERTEYIEIVVEEIGECRPIQEVERVRGGTAKFADDGQ